MPPILKINGRLETEVEVGKRRTRSLVTKLGRRGTRLSLRGGGEGRRRHQREELELEVIQEVSGCSSSSSATAVLVGSRQTSQMVEQLQQQQQPSLREIKEDAMLEEAEELLGARRPEEVEGEAQVRQGGDNVCSADTSSDSGCVSGSERVKGASPTTSGDSGTKRWAKSNTLML